MGKVPQWLLVNDNGQPAVTFDVFQQDNADSVSLAQEVQARLDEFMKTQPKSIHSSSGTTRPNWFNSSIKAIEEAILIGLVFAGFVIMAFLRNWRATTVAVIVVPMSVLVTACSVGARDERLIS